jgi:hypothetical protein
VRIRTQVFRLTRVKLVEDLNTVSGFLILSFSIHQENTPPEECIWLALLSAPLVRYSTSHVLTASNNGCTCMLSTMPSNISPARCVIHIRQAYFRVLNQNLLLQRYL